VSIHDVDGDRNECGQSEGSNHNKQGWGESPDGEGETEGIP